MIPNDRSQNPHWIGDKSCRDYVIGNITLLNVPDSFVFSATKFRGGYGFAIGNVNEFLANCGLVINYTPGTVREAHDGKVAED